MGCMLAIHSLSGYRSNSLIVHCFIHLLYHLDLKWTLEGHSLNQLLLKFKVLHCLECFISTLGFALSDYETSLRYIIITLNLNNKLYLVVLTSQR